MSTQKQIKIQNNKILTVTASKPGFRTVTRSFLANGDNTETINMLPDTDIRDTYTVGDRLLGISSFVCYFTPSGTYDTGEGLKYVTAKQTVGNSLNDIEVGKSQWWTYVNSTIAPIVQGTSVDFIFTYNGTTWDLTGGATLTGITASELTDNFGITFTSTPVENDVITVNQSYYSKYACFVLDANYRINSRMTVSSRTPGRDVLPNLYSSVDGALNGLESATWANEYIYNTYNYDIKTYHPDIANCNDRGNFIIIGNRILKPVLPNLYELKKIFDSRQILDTRDTSDSVNKLLTIFPLTATSNGGAVSINFEKYRQTGNFMSHLFWYIYANLNSGSTVTTAAYGTVNHDYNKYSIPVFELPCM